MTNKKLSGSFYTPKIVANFLVDYLSEKLKDNTSISILEPSAGDGIFIKTIYNNELFASRIERVVAIEQNLEELNKISVEITADSFHAIHHDFLDYQKNNEERFSLVIGNPPYIKKNYLTEKQLETCKEIHREANLASVSPKNIWTSFLVRCVTFLNTDGILSFILPADLLQVKYAEEIRELISKQFERVEIFTFNELLFDDCKGQDTVILIGEKKTTSNCGIYYCNIDKVATLEKREFTLSQNIKIKESKWTHHHLETEDIELIEKLRHQVKPINNYCTSKAGIVTAANSYFIVNSDTVERYSLQNFIKPIIQKGFFVNGSVELSQEDFNTLTKKSKPTYLIALDKNSVIETRSALSDYIKVGEELEIDKRYKTSLRNKWYEVPNIGNASEAFFFKRCDEYPKLIKNSAQILATDSAYLISMIPDFDINSLIYSFYNSLTLTFAELYGRYYGGGVLELTPNEFKKVPLPYININAQDFKSFADYFKFKKNIKEVLILNDRAILKSFDKDLDEDTIQRLFNIREKLFLRRTKKT